MDLITQAINAVRAIADPAERFRVANELDDKLLKGRTATADLKRSAVEELRGPDFGYQRIASTLGLTKSRIAQITKTPPVLRVYAVRDETGHWYPAGAENLLPEGTYEEGTVRFRPVETVRSPLANQDLTARFGQVDVPWSFYTVHVKLPGDVERVIGTTPEVHDAMFGG